MMTSVKNNITEPSSAHIEEGESFELKASSTSQGQKSKHRHSSFGYHESHEWKAAERRVVRKLDMTLLPVVWVLYRTAVLYSGLVLATAFSGLIAAGIFSGLSDKAGLHGWQWLFIIEGAGSALAAICAFALLPDFPDSQTGSGKWLFSADELELAQQRIALDRVSVPEADRSIWHGLLLAVKDIRTWIFVIILCANHTAYGFNNFFPT
ncbi:hypothetical protein COL940_014104 [Colletotrichum noveboracense]|nr:hypothetical protein COL940_014104 [Colletotrichum noveboracense]